jgi:hypothetical protein
MIVEQFRRGKKGEKVAYKESKKKKNEKELNRTLFVSLEVRSWRHLLQVVSSE